MDISGLKHLWGSPREVGERLRRVAAERDLSVRVAIAATKMAALLATQGQRGLTVIPPQAEAEAVATLPLSVVKQLSKVQAQRGHATSGPSTSTRTRRRPDTANTVVPASSSSRVVSVLLLLPVVQRWGIKTLGELASLPATELFSRLGHGGLELQRIARGEDSRPLVPEPDEERFEETIALEWPIEGLEPLSFVLGRVVDPLCAHLNTRGVAAGMVHVRLTLVSREVHERTLRFPAAINDPKVLRTLILLDLDAHPPSGSRPAFRQPAGRRLVPILQLMLERVVVLRTVALETLTRLPRWPRNSPRSRACAIDTSPGRGFALRSPAAPGKHRGPARPRTGGTGSTPAGVRLDNAQEPFVPRHRDAQRDDHRRLGDVLPSSTRATTSSPERSRSWSSRSFVALA